METSYKEKYEQAIERLKQWDREHPCAGFVLSDRDKFIFPELAESEQKPNGGIVREDFTQGDGWYKVNLDYLSKAQVEEIEQLVEKWNPKEVSEDEKIKKAILIYLDWLDGKKDYLPKGDYTIKDMILWLEKQGQVKESTISQHENRTCEENDDSLTCEDGKIRKEIINYFRCQSEEEPTRKEIHNKWISWLENIQYTIDHEKREGFHLGYKACLEKQGKNSVRWNENTDDKKPQKHHSVLMKTTHGIAEGEWQGNKWFQYRWSSRLKDDDVLSWVEFHDLEKQSEQKPEENKGNIGGISSNSEWSDEDEENFCSVYLDVKSARQNTVNSLSGDLKEQEQKRMDEVISWLESLKGRVQPKQEWSEEDKYMYDILCGTIENTDINENTKYKLISWLKFLRPQNTWKPSDEQMEALWLYAEQNNYDGAVLTSLYNDLKKLKEGKV